MSESTLSESAVSESTTSESTTSESTTSDANCDFELTGENLTALWLEFQKQQAEKADCPVTNAPISLELKNDPAQGQGEPVVRVKCSKCGRETEFAPGKHEGFSWAE